MYKGWQTATLALLLACGGHAAAGQVNVSCEVDSDYDFALSERSVIFTRDSPAPKQLVMRQGRLFVDDRWVTLSAADRTRLIDYERQARAVVPLAQEVGRDAAEIAFVALGGVAAGFSNDPDKTRRTLEKARRQLDTRLADEFGPSHYRTDELGETIGEVVRDVLPTLVGDIVGGAVRAAFSGDTGQLQNFEQRMDGLDAEIESMVEPKAESLERNARALCDRMQALDRIDDALEYRLPDGRPLDLLTVRVDHDRD